MTEDEGWRASRFLVADDEMNDAGRIGNPEAVEIFAQLFDFVAPRDAVDFQIRRCRFRVVRFQFQPDIGMTQVRHAIDPEPVRTELENAAVRFLLDQRQSERVAIKRDRLLIGVTRAFDRDIRAAGKLRAVDVGDHDESCESETPNRLAARGTFAARFRHRDSDRARRSVRLPEGFFSRDKFRAPSSPSLRFPSRSSAARS